jgi:hypothetical protein
MGDTAVCDVCGKAYGVGQWYRCPHDPVVARGGFTPYFDIGLGREVTGWGDVRQAMREEKLDFRDPPSAERTERYVERARLSRERRGVGRA